MVQARRLGTWHLAVGVVFPLLSLLCFADSHARVVRLSEVQGSVRIDRNTGQGFENAFLNLPLTQGTKLRTQDGGEAAIEFEDGSTIRLAPGSEIDVPELSLGDSGSKISSIHLQEGTAYVTFFGSKGDVLDITFAREKVSFTQPAHARIVLGDVDAAVSVFKGEVGVSGPKGAVGVAKNHTANFDLIDDHYELANNIEQYPFDGWDKQESKYQEQYTDARYSNYSPYAYGTSDLSYYGNFFTVPGYGMMWQPYFVGAGWDPFMNGAWASYPGVGYGWVSAYPWGWTPYHYGSWAFVPGYGWAWQPGGAWMGWNTVPVILNPPAGFAAPRPPTLPGQRIYPINHSPVTAATGNKVQIANNSAGLGIPFGSVRNLAALSHTVEQKGFVTTTVHSSMSTNGYSGWGRAGAVPVGRTGTATGHSGSSSFGHSMGGAHGSVGHH